MEVWAVVEEGRWTFPPMSSYFFEGSKGPQRPPPHSHPRHFTILLTHLALGLPSAVMHSQSPWEAQGGWGLHGKWQMQRWMGVAVVVVVV